MLTSMALALTLVTAQVEPEAPVIRKQIVIRAGAIVPPPLAAAPNPTFAADDEALLGSVDLPTDPASLTAFLRRQKISDTDRARIATLIRDLGDDDFDRRQGATDELIRIGPAAVGPLKDALKTKDLEVLRRAESCLKAIDSVAGTAYQEAVIRLLAKKAPEPAVGVLLDVVPELRGTSVLDAVALSLAQAGVRGGRPVPALLLALADKASARREVAGEAIARSGDDDARQTVKPLLNDADPLVRIRVASALLARGEADALPVAIRLLQEAPLDRAYDLESQLLAVAGEQAPVVGLGKTADSRKLAGEAWQAWFEKTGKKLDLAKVVADAAKPGALVVLGQTVAVPIKSKVTQIDAAGKPVWDFEVAGTAYAVQKLPKDRVLVAEYTGRKVTERTTKGEVIWTKELTTYPVDMQRLPNGNTLIGTRNQIIEVDGTGKDVRTLPRTDLIYAFAALRNGEITIITSASRCIRLDATGKELGSFQLAGRVYTTGAHFAVSPNGGRITVPMHYPVAAVNQVQNRVIEYDNTGKVIWEAVVDRPTCVRRLPNGHVLVSSRFHTTVVELDGRGKQVNKYEAPAGLRSVLDVQR